MRNERERNQERLNSIFLEMGMDKDVASLISGVKKKQEDKRRNEKEKDIDNNRRR